MVVCGEGKAVRGTILPSLATKDDIHKLEPGFVKWSVGLALGIAGIVIGYLSLTKTAQSGIQPIVIQIPAMQQTPVAQTPAAPASHSR